MQRSFGAAEQVMEKQHDATWLNASKSGCGKAPTFEVVWRSAGGNGDKREDDQARLGAGTLMTHKHKNLKLKIQHRYGARQCGLYGIGQTCW